MKREGKAFRALEHLTAAGILLFGCISYSKEIEFFF